MDKKSNLMKTSFLTYSNSKCEDLWKGYFSRLDKYAPNIKGVFISDKNPNSGHIWSEYNNDEPYWEVFSRSIDKIETDTLIYMQEDFILYDFIQKDLIKKAIEILENDKEISFIRFIKCGELINEEYEKPFYRHTHITKNPHYSINSYSMQPTLWKKEKLKELVIKTKEEKWFESMNYTKSMNELEIYGLYVYQEEERVGGHFYSNIFPYIATALVRGKWNFSEYPKRMKDFFDEYLIDFNTRGII